MERHVQRPSRARPWASLSVRGATAAITVMAPPTMRRQAEALPLASKTGLKGKVEEKERTNKKKNRDQYENDEKDEEEQQSTVTTATTTNNMMKKQQKRQQQQQKKPNQFRTFFLC